MSTQEDVRIAEQLGRRVVAVIEAPSSDHVDEGKEKDPYTL